MVKGGDHSLPRERGEVREADSRGGKGKSKSTEGQATQGSMPGPKGTTPSPEGTRTRAANTKSNKGRTRTAPRDRTDKRSIRGQQAQL